SFEYKAALMRELKDPEFRKFWGSPEREAMEKAGGLSSPEAVESVMPEPIAPAPMPEVVPPAPESPASVAKPAKAKPRPAKKEKPGKTFYGLFVQSLPGGKRGVAVLETSQIGRVPGRPYDLKPIRVYTSKKTAEANREKWIEGNAIKVDSLIP